MTKTELLQTIEWHDLPLSELRIAEATVDLIVTPYSDQDGAYSSATLSLADCETVAFNIRGELSSLDQINLEIKKLDFQIHSNGKISGEIGILPGDAGYWTISFKNAAWDLFENDEQA